MLDLNKCINLINASLTDYNKKLQEENKQLKEFIKIVNNLDLDLCKNFNPDKFGQNLEILQPFENSLINSIDDLVQGPVDDIKENKWAYEKLKSFKTIAIDTSEMFTTHYFPVFILMNIGLFYYDYKNNDYIEYSIPKFFTKYHFDEIDDDRSIPLKISILRLENELLVLEQIDNEKSLEESYIMFDESFSSNYLKSSNKDIIRAIMEKIKHNIGYLIKKNAKPIGIIYSLSRGFVNFLKFFYNMEQIQLNDKQIFNEILLPGERSCIFKVHNLTTKIADLNMYAFYLKISDNNVLRIEFEERLKDKVNEIQHVVFLQSIMGGGYPICMQRAHELAYINEKEREFIFELIEEKLIKEGIKLSQFGFTKKQERKLIKII
jgi:NurA domain.